MDGGNTSSVLPELQSYTTFYQAFIAILCFLGLLVALFYFLQRYKKKYMPKYEMLIGFLMGNVEQSQRRFKEYIHSLANENEHFTSLRSQDVQEQEDEKEQVIPISKETFADFSKEENVASPSSSFVDSSLKKMKYFINSFLCNYVYRMK